MCDKGQVHNKGDSELEKIEALKLFMQMFGGDAQPGSAVGGVAKSSIGKYVIVRSCNEGINAGLVVDADETGILLSKARRLWYHEPRVTTESWYEGVANHGLSTDSRVSGVVSEKAIIEDYSVTVCTDEARQSIETAVAHVQS